MKFVDVRFPTLSNHGRGAFIVLVILIELIGFAMFGQTQWTKEGSAVATGTSSAIVAPAAPMALVTTNASNGTNGSNGVVGIAVPRAKVSFAWDDAKLSNSNIVAYEIYCGTDLLGLPNIGTLTNWTDTNGEVYFTVSNINPAEIYNFTVAAVDRNEGESDDAPYLAFMAAGYLIAGTNGGYATVTFYPTANHLYTIQSRAAGTNVWTSLDQFANYQGLMTYTDTAPMLGAKFYRVKIQ